MGSLSVVVVVAPPSLVVLDAVLVLIDLEVRLVCRDDGEYELIRIVILCPELADDLGGVS